MLPYLFPHSMLLFSRFLTVFSSGVWRECVRVHERQPCFVLAIPLVPLFEASGKMLQDKKKRKEKKPFVVSVLMSK